MYCLDEKLLNKGLQIANRPNILKQLNENRKTEKANKSRNDENYHAETANEFISQRDI